MSMVTVMQAVKNLLIGIGAVVLILGAANAYLGVPLPGQTEDTPVVLSGPNTSDSGAQAGDPTVTLTATRQPETTVALGRLNHTRVEEHVHSIINNVRRNNSVPTLLYDDNLAYIARQHSKNMAVNGYVGHVQPDGTTRADRYDAGNYDCRVETTDGYLTGGENVAKMYAFTQVDVNGQSRFADEDREVAQLIVDLWMASPGHRKNLLREEWNRQGIGVWIVYEADRAIVYATQNFC